MQGAFKILFLLIFTAIANLSQAQYKQPRHKFWTVGWNLGMMGWSPSNLNVISGTNAYSRTLNYGAGAVIDNFGQSHPALIANTSIGLNAGFMWFDRGEKGFTSIQAELQNNKACYEFTPPFNYSFHGDSLGNWVEADKYVKYSIALQRGWRLNESSILGGNSFWYVREGFGQTLLHRNIGNPVNELLALHHQEDWTQNGTGMKSDIVALNTMSWTLSSEIGIKACSKNNKNSFDVGIVYYAPFTNTFTEQYEFFKQGVSVGKSQITYNGGTVMLNARYTFGYKTKEKPIDTTHVPGKETPLVNHKINGRHVIVQHSMDAKNSDIKVLVWDRGTVDGDKISLYLNGELVLDDYTLTKDKREVAVHLQPGANYLVMHALNLGSIPPNTAAMEVDDGPKKKSFSLVSYLDKSGTIEINYNP